MAAFLQALPSFCKARSQYPSTLYVFSGAISVVSTCSRAISSIISLSSSSESGDSSVGGRSGRFAAVNSLFNNQHARVSSSWMNRISSGFLMDVHRSIEHSNNRVKFVVIWKLDSYRKLSTVHIFTHYENISFIAWVRIFKIAKLLTLRATPFESRWDFFQEENSCRWWVDMTCFSIS